MKKIMIVDDEPDILFLTGIMLRKEGYEVIEASGGRQCLEKLEKERPNLILLDILGTDGCKTLEKIKGDRRFKSIPVLLFTVVTEHYAARSLKCAGYSGYIEKPFERDVMLGHIERLLGTPEEAVD